MSPQSGQMSTGSVINDDDQRAPRLMQQSAFPGENSAFLDARSTIPITDRLMDHVYPAQLLECQMWRAPRRTLAPPSEGSQFQDTAAVGSHAAILDNEVDECRARRHLGRAEMDGVVWRNPTKHQVKALAAPGERRMIGRGEPEAHHPEERRQKALGLTEG